MKRLILKWLGLGNTTVVIGEEKISIPLVSTIQNDIAHLQEELRCSRSDHTRLKKVVENMETRTIALEYLKVIDDDAELIVFLNRMIQKYDEFLIKPSGSAMNTLANDIANNVSNDDSEVEEWKKCRKKFKSYIIDNTKNITIN